MSLSCTYIHDNFISKSDASYIVNLEEYQTLANKILKRTPTKPIIVFIEMPAVKKALSKKVSISASLQLLITYLAEEDWVPVQF
jgi:hypothetical protein